MALSDDPKFLAKIKKTSTCWLWQGSTNGIGYGQLNRRALLKIPLLAHSYSWFLEHGILPSQCVCHKCDTPLCVRPSHLFVGTHQDNMTDCNLKGRGNQGSKHGLSKLTEPQIIRIRALHSKGRTMAFLADMYRVHRSNIEHIIHRRRWRHV